MINIDNEFFGYVKDNYGDWLLELREDCENLDFLFDTKDFEIDLSKRLVSNLSGEYDILYGMIDRYGEKVANILLNHIKEMKDSVEPMDGYGKVVVGKTNDVEDYKRFLRDIANCCDDSVVKTFNIDGADYIVYVEYE